MLHTDKYETNGAIHTYRFWMQAGRREELALGIVRDSCDRLGRAFPLLIMAHGIVKEWYKSWHYIFQEWESMFRDLETAATSQYMDFQDFQARLKKIRFPEALAPHPPYCDDTGCPAALVTPESTLALFRHNQNQDAVCIPASSLKAPDFSSDEKMVKKYFFSKPAIPASMFFGGIPEAPILSIYNRPLRPKDFSDLFNLVPSC
jgi:type VI secretion system protein VasJ